MFDAFTNSVVDAILVSVVNVCFFVVVVAVAVNQHIINIAIKIIYQKHVHNSFKSLILFLHFLCRKIVNVGRSILLFMNRYTFQPTDVVAPLEEIVLLQMKQSFNKFSYGANFR